MKDGYKKISVSVVVADGESCKVKTATMSGVCHFHIAKSCRLFSKVIVDHKKCPECLTA